MEANDYVKAQSPNNSSLACENSGTWNPYNDEEGVSDSLSSYQETTYHQDNQAVNKNYNDESSLTHPNITKIQNQNLNLFSSESSDLDTKDDFHEFTDSSYGNQNKKSGIIKKKTKEVRYKKPIKKAKKVKKQKKKLSFRQQRKQGEKCSRKIRRLNDIQKQQQQDQHISNIKQLVKEYNVPPIYQMRLCAEIMTVGRLNCQQVLDNHKKGGVKYNKEQLLMFNNKTIEQQMKIKSENFKVFSLQKSEDSVSQQNICNTHESDLREITIKELRKGVIEPNTILWLTTIADSSQLVSIKVVCQDKNNDCICLGLYNQLNQNMSFTELQTYFPKGIKIGLKQPYLNVAYGGVLALRNDNPSNIVLINNAGIDMALSNYDNSILIKSRGNYFFKRGEYMTALKCFKSALQLIEQILSKDKIQQLNMISNIAQCYMNLNLYEDALDYCNMALQIEPVHLKSICLKGKSQAYLFRLDRSLANFVSINYSSGQQLVQQFKEQMNGDYYDVIKNPNSFLDQNKILNFIHCGVEIKMTTDDKGRGIFASKFLKKGTLLVVEKAIAEAEQNKNLNVVTYADKSTNLVHVNDNIQVELVKKCSELCQLKGIEALRISYLYDGGDKNQLLIPPSEIFVNNYYKNYEISDISIEKLNKIVCLNTFSQNHDMDNKQRNTNQVSKSSLFCFKSLINHSESQNIKAQYISSDVVFIFAAKDIELGEELLFDYCHNVQHTKERNQILQKYGIVESD